MTDTTSQPVRAELTSPNPRVLLDDIVGDLTFRVTGTCTRPGTLTALAEGDVFHAQHPDEQVGGFRREFNPHTGVAFHYGFHIDRPGQRRGWGSEWVARCVERYRQFTDLTEVQLVANQVSAYQWARVGFDWITPPKRDSLRTAALHIATRYPQAATLAEAFAERVRAGYLPTAPELANYGRAPRNNVGKRIMLCLRDHSYVKMRLPLR